MKNYQRVLFPYAYNILGSADDAKDAIQDVMSAFLMANHEHVENEKNYLIRSVINRAITIKNKKKKLRYGDVWLPEPVATEGADTQADLKDIVSYSLLILLEQLTAKERAVFILKEAFSYSHEDISGVLSTTVETSRKILSRAKEKLKHQPASTRPKTGSSSEVLHHYIAAIRARNIEQLEALLSQDIAFHADGGANMNIVAKHLSGAHEVSGLLLYIYDKYQTGFSIIPAEINHEPSLLFYSGSTLVSCQVFDLSPEGKILRINTIIDPEKLKNIQLPVR